MSPPFKSPNINAVHTLPKSGGPECSSLLPQFLKTLLETYVCTMNSEHAAVHRAPAALCWDQGHSHTGATAGPVLTHSFCCEADTGFLCPHTTGAGGQLRSTELCVLTSAQAGQR